MDAPAHRYCKKNQVPLIKHQLLQIFPVYFSIDRGPPAGGGVSGGRRESERELQKRRRTDASSPGDFFCTRFLEYGLEEIRRIGFFPQAAKHNREGIITFLSHRGASLDARDGDGRTPVAAAIKFGSGSAVIGTLLSLGADGEIADNSNLPPLYHVRTRHRQIPLNLSFYNSIFNQISGS